MATQLLHASPEVMAVINAAEGHIAAETPAASVEEHVAFVTDAVRRSLTEEVYGIRLTPDDVIGPLVRAAMVGNVVIP